MAVLEVKVPQLSESVTEATLLQWHKQAGEAVTLDENLVDVETDKVVLELPCPANGVLTQILKRDGSIVVAGEVIALVDTEAMASAESKPQEPQTREMELFASAPAAEPVAAVASAPVPVDPPAKLEKEEDLEIAAFDSGMLFGVADEQHPVVVLIGKPDDLRSFPERIQTGFVNDHIAAFRRLPRRLQKTCDGTRQLEAFAFQNIDRAVGRSDQIDMPHSAAAEAPAQFL